MSFDLSPSRLIRTLFACAAVTLAAHATGTGFAASLTPQDKAASGISQLSASQTAALDALVARDQSLARQGDVTSFASTFSQRRTPKERAEAGLTRLNPAQQSRLDHLVALAIADQPHSFVSYGPRDAYVPGDPFAATPWRPEIHGELSLTYGTGKGGSFYGSSLETTMTDPSGKYSISLGISEYHGKGLYYPCGLP